MKGNLMKRKKRIALVAHDERKEDLLEWVEWVKFNKKSWQHKNCGLRELPAVLYRKIVPSKYLN
jgi:hypothetical protein